ncbi:hypothetical protein ACNKHK_14670 [Shigella flexneri]
MNGQDNSLILISSIWLKNITSGFKESTIGNLSIPGRAEMLQQANALMNVKASLHLRRVAARQAGIGLPRYARPLIARTSGNGCRL